MASAILRKAWQGKWALVTGASAGIGEALAVELAEAGVHLVLTARRQDRLDALAERLRSRHSIQTNVIVADLGLPDADTHFLKAQIVSEIYRITTERKLTQARAGKLMGITQPEVSRMFKGNFREYSIDRLMSFLTSFDRDVEIVVKPHKKAGKAGRIIFSPLAA